MQSKPEQIKQARISFSTYIVQLYRFQKNKPQRLMGIVEEAGTMKKSAFADYDELWAILNSSKAGRVQEKKGEK
jgi:hypothetical protein